jgi:hypothetical protein
MAWTLPQQPEALKSVGNTGKAQTRSSLFVGRAWTETYEPYIANDAVFRAWLSTVQRLWRTGEAFTIAHRAYLTANGPGGGTPLINGASQTGSSIATDGWPNSITVLKAGDLVKLGALSLTHELTADAVSNGSGQANLQVEPIIVAGGSPADNATVLYGASVTFNALLTSFDVGRTTIDGWIEGVTLGFMEAP